MKISFLARIVIASRFSVSLALLLGASPLCRAADSSWTSTTTGSWGDSAKWAALTIPGSTSSSTSPDIATFTGSGTPITVDANRNIGGLTLASTTTSYTFNSGSLRFSSGGQLSRTAGNSAGIVVTINTPMVIEGSPGTLTINNSPNAVAAIMAIKGGISGVASSGNTSTLTLDGTATGFNDISTATISDGANGGKLAVVKNGSGQWRINKSDNSFSGGMTLNVGTLTVLNATGTPLGYGTFTYNGGSLSLFTATTLTLTNAVVFGADFADTITLTLSGPVSFGGAVRTITISSTKTLTLSGTLSNGGLGLAGAGAADLTTANLTGLTDNLVIALATAVSSSSIPTNSGKLIKLGATTTASTFTYTGGDASSDRTVDLAGTTGGASIVNNGAGNLTLTRDFTASGAGSKTLTLGGSSGGSIQGAIVNNSSVNKTALTKSGTGTWTLSGINTNTEATTVSAGKLLNNGALGVTAISVSASATFGGTGTCGSTLTYAVNSTNVSTITASNGTNTTPLTVTGVLACGTGLFVHLNAPNDLGNGVYTLVTSSATPTGTINNPTAVFDSGSLGSGGTGVVSLDAANKSLIYTVTGVSTGNQPPVVVDDNFSHGSGASMKIAITSLLANDTDADNDTIQFVSTSATTTNSSALTNDATFIYVPASSVNDAFTYTVHDGNGGTNTGNVYLTVESTNGGTTTVIPTSTNATVTFFGIPGQGYTPQRATNVTFDEGVTNFPSVTAPGNGVFSVTDDFSDLGEDVVPESAFYRLVVP